MATAQGGNLPKIRRRNLELIKEMILKYGAVSRAEIAETLSLTPPTITTTVAKLIKQGLVIERESLESENEEKSLGRRRIMLSLNPQAQYYLGIELGPYHTAFCAVDLCGQAVHSACFDPCSYDYVDRLPQLAQQIQQVIADSGISEQKYCGITVGLPGFIDKHKGEIRNSPRASWNEHRLAQDLQERVGLPLCIENNVRVRAIGAEFYNAQELRDVETLAYYFISMGVACSMMIKNSVIAGYTAGAGEVGHMVVDINGPVCETCGNRGCLEAMASEKAILSTCRTMTRSGRGSLLQALCPDIEQLEMKQVMQAYGRGDEVAVEVVRDAVTYLGIALANIINFISPQMVMVDGYIFQSEETRKLLRQIVYKNLFALNAFEINMKFVEFDRLSGAKGAAAMAIREFFIKSESEA